MLEKIKQIVAEAMDTEISKLNDNTAFKEDLGADSLDLFELVMTIEEEFNVEIPTDNLVNIKTLGDVRSYLEAQGI